MAGTVSAVSGSTSVYETDTKVMEAHPEVMDFIFYEAKGEDVLDYALRDLDMKIRKFFEEGQKTKKKK